MAETKPEPKAGDPCPNCGGELVEFRAPTDQERKFAEDKEHARVYPPRVDTASAEERARLGPLAECRDCAYRTRYTPTPEDRAEAREEKTRGRAKAGAGSSKD